MHLSRTSLASGLLLAGNALAIDLNLDDEGSIRDASKTIAARIVQRYTSATDGPGGIPGLLGDPYYFWENGLAWDSLLNYWYHTGDDSYNALIGEALRHQLGENNDYMPANQTKSEGNDDQSTWALAAMTAAESGFPEDVLAGLNTTWADIAIDIFNQQAARWDYETCAGGLRWQIFPFNNGYDYVNAISNGNFYQLASRLSRFTGNSTYEEWSDRVLAWSVNVGLVADENTGTPGAVYDGTSTTEDCSDINRIQWSANAGTYLAGAAYAWNATQTRWTPLHASLLPSITSTFASGRANSTNGTLFEIACAPRKNCNTDQLAFRAILARALAQTRALITSLPTTAVASNASSIANITAAAQSQSPAAAADLHATIDFILRESAKGAAAQCSGGENGTTCGDDWSSSEWDGTSGLGQDLSALNVIVANVRVGGRRLATANGSATEAGSNDTEVVNGSGASGDNSTTADSASSAGHVVVSSMVLATVAVGSMVVFL